MRLSNAALAGLPPSVLRPSYDRSAVTAGIVHLGLGAFHRSHQAVYVEDRLAQGETGWGIVGASLRSADTRDALAPQDGLYTLSIRDSDSEQLRVVGSILDILVAPESPARLIERLSDPAIRIVSLTITEKGYAVDLGTGSLKLDHPDIVHDLAHPQMPRSALGLLAEAIDRRRRAGAPPFTVLSCDNLPQNGKTLRRLLTGFAAERSRDLADYIAAEIPCPSSMVDRIVPATTDEDRRAIAAALGREDAWPVLTEPFTQWVVEDRFVAGRPRFEDSGVEFVDDVQPFEHMKLRLLNGTHTCMGAVGRLAGFDTVSRCIADPGVLTLVERHWREVIPTLSIPADRAFAYTRQLLARYGNRSLHHRTAQLASDASQKLTPRIVYPIRECLARGLPCGTLIFAVAAWIRSCGGKDEQGRPLPLNDPTFQAWTGQPDQQQAAPDEVVDAFLGLSFVFGDDLPRNAAFTTALKRAYRAIASQGVLAAARQV
ncbi:mannitol dehydrogenase family protein [Labrys monachus]|uniref:Fructuronate reductase n=1 Tax=Labrys monachus TaxID=217067 RepID=A0ABU0FIN2_9HYPH|nr:mannitol dehydrogenase family protein [Labrys monachus]MDQ0394187.1 fructuronate reductase [Labrys monachus]